MYFVPLMGAIRMRSKTASIISKEGKSYDDFRYITQIIWIMASIWHPGFGGNRYVARIGASYPCFVA